MRCIKEELEVKTWVGIRLGKTLSSLWRNGDFIPQLVRHPQCLSQWNGTLGDSRGGLGLKTGEETVVVCPCEVERIGTTSGVGDGGVK